MRTSWTVGGALAVLAGTMVAAQGFGSKTPTALRAIPAETTAAKAKDPNWKAPKTAWGHPNLEGVWTSDDMRAFR